MAHKAIKDLFCAPQALELLLKLMYCLTAAPTSVAQVARAMLPVRLAVKAICDADADMHHPLDFLQGSYAGGGVREDEP